jgi:nucleoside-diphosphate-sugar epimerase
VSVFAFGLGYSAGRVIARGRLGAGSGTARTAESAAAWRARGVEAYRFDGAAYDPEIPQALTRAQVALVSIPPDARGDPTLAVFAQDLARAGLERIVYLSTVGVYGDADGAFVDETSPTLAATPRARARVEAEAAWTKLGREAGLPVDILRLGGIYGPGRSAFDRLRDGTARAVVKPGQVFNRIHVDDIAGAVEAVVAAGRPGDVYNVVDGAPAPPEDVIVHAAGLLDVPAPASEPFATATMSPMARSFYEENRRIRPDKLRAIGWAPAYPTYREGLGAIRALEAERQSR